MPDLEADPDLDGLLEFCISKQEADSCTVELRFDDLASRARNEAVRGRAEIKPEELRLYQSKLQIYGEILSKGLFHDESIRSAFNSSKALIQARNGRLRISLVVDPDAPQLQALAWELLTDPVSHARLSTSETTPFSRFLFGRDWTGFPLRRKGDLKALIAAPNPSRSSMEAAGLAPVDAEAEVQRAREVLGDLHVSVLEGPVTMEALLDAIAQGFDVVYLICHGALREPEKRAVRAGTEDFEIGFGEDEAVTKAQGLKAPVLFLEKDDTREVAAVSGGRFARRLADLRPHPLPRLIVLASCESAGVKDDWTGQSAQASLAPRLARAGVPAIVAMQGQISIATAQQFMKTFFEGLASHGSIDQAMASARGRVRERPDCWMPALFIRLKDGRLWYEPRFAPGAKVTFATMADEIVLGKVTPILGWGLAEKIYGTKAGLAERLAEEKKVPLERHRRRELALVSQYLQVKSRSDASALNSLKERMRCDVLERYRGRFSEDLSEATLSRLLNMAGRLERESEADPYRTIAAMPATVMINASPDGLLIEALKAIGKTPTIRTPVWRRCAGPAEMERLNPTVSNPLVLQVFGHFADPDSIVLGEDDYLDYLMGVAQNQALISNVVKEALTNRALLFLGFQMTDWTFRVLFRIVMRLLAGAQDRQRRRPNVAVQVEPDDALFAGVTEAEEYLREFYSHTSIEPYWGTSADFLEHLAPELKARAGHPRMEPALDEY